LGLLSALADSCMHSATCFATGRLRPIAPRADLRLWPVSDPGGRQSGAHQHDVPWDGQLDAAGERLGTGCPPQGPALPVRERQGRTSALEPERRLGSMVFRHVCHMQILCAGAPGAPHTRLSVISGMPHSRTAGCHHVHRGGRFANKACRRGAGGPGKGPAQQEGGPLLLRADHVEPCGGQGARPPCRAMCATRMLHGALAMLQPTEGRLTAESGVRRAGAVGGRVAGRHLCCRVPRGRAAARASRLPRAARGADGRVLGGGPGRAPGLLSRAGASAGAVPRHAAALPDAEGDVDISALGSSTACPGAKAPPPALLPPRNRIWCGLACRGSFVFCLSTA
jgi:hypothetical protein